MSTAADALRFLRALPRNILSIFFVLVSLLGVLIVLSLLTAAYDLSPAAAWKRAHHDPYLRAALYQTLYMLIISCSIQIGIAAITTAYIPALRRTWVRIILILPYCAGPLAPAFAFYVFFSTGVGPFNVGWFDSTLAGYLLIALIDTWEWLGVLLLACYLTLDGIPETHFEQCRLEAIDHWQSWRLIVWPRLAGVFVLYAVIRSVDWFRKVDIPTALFGRNGGPGGVYHTIASYTAWLYFQSDSSHAYGALLALAQLAIFAAAVGFLILAANRLGFERSDY